METVNDWAIYLQKVQDYVSSVQSIIDRRILPSLRKREEETDGKSDSSHTHTDIDPDINGRTDLAAVPALDDEFILYDTSATANRKVDFQDIRRDIAEFEAAAGNSDQATSTAIAGHFMQVHTVAGGANGARLPTWGQGSPILVENSDASDTLKLFPPTDGTINSGATNASIDVAAGSWALCRNVDGTDWRVKVF